MTKREKIIIFISAYKCMKKLNELEDRKIKTCADRLAIQMFEKELKSYESAFQSMGLNIVDSTMSPFQLMGFKV